MADQKKSRELRHQLGVAVTAMRALLDKVETEKRAPTADEQRQIDGFNTECGKLDDQIRLHEGLEKREAEMLANLESGTHRPAAPAGSPPVDEKRAKHAAAFRRFLTCADARQLSAADQAVLAEYRGPEGVRAPSPFGEEEARKFHDVFEARADVARRFGEKRALAMTTGPAGAYTVPTEEFIPELIKKVDNIAAVFALGRKFFTPQAQSLGGVSLDADPADGDWTTELATGNEDTTMDFARRELQAFPIAKLLKVSRKLLRASPLGIENIVRDRLAYKLAMPIDTAGCTGTGVNQPLGVFTAGGGALGGISTARDVDVSTSHALSADKLITARFSIRDGYIPTWVLHRLIMANIRQLKATTGNYLWQPGLTIGVPSTLLDFPYVLDENAPSAMASGTTYIAVLGDFSYYWWNIALNIEIQRVDELYAATNQVGFIPRAELDGMPVLEDAFVRCVGTWS